MILQDVCLGFFHFLLKTNVLCSPGHKTFGLGTGMEQPETGNCAAIPALRIAPKCFLKVDIVRKKQSLPTFPSHLIFPLLGFHGTDFPCFPLL